MDYRKIALEGLSVTIKARFLRSHYHSYAHLLLAECFKTL